jgi:hypothetical protein
MEGSALDAIYGAFFLAWLISWGFFCVAGAVLLSRHEQGTLGFVYAFFLGPMGVLMAFLKAENLDAQARDKALFDLVRHALLTRETNPVGAPGGTGVAPTPRGRAYDEIMTSEPPKPRRFR